MPNKKVLTLRDAGDMLAEAGRVVAAGGHCNRAVIALLKLQLELVLMRQHHLGSTPVADLVHRLNEALLPDAEAIIAELKLAFDDEEPYPRRPATSASVATPTSTPAT